MKRRIDEVDQSNGLVTLAINRTKTSIRRLRLEYAVLLERLESNAITFPDNIEEMSPPPSPSFEFEASSKPPKKQKKPAAAKATAKARVRDPNLPKRPTNAYLIFCEMEKERIKQQTGDTSLSAIPELGKSLVEAWKNLSEEEKKPYQKVYEDDRERYKREMAIYNSEKQGGQATPAIDAEDGELATNEELANQMDEEEDHELPGANNEDLEAPSEPPSEAHSEFHSELPSEPPSEANYNIKQEE